MAELKFDISKVVEGAIKEFKHQGYHVSKWIRCKDKMPEEYKTVLVYEKDYGVMIGELEKKFFDTQYFIARKSGLILRTTEVTHWQPLPEPPKQWKGNLKVQKGAIMSDYISKQKVLDYLNGYLHSLGDDADTLFNRGQRRALINSIQDILAVKAADVQPTEKVEEYRSLLEECERKLSYLFECEIESTWESQKVKELIAKIQSCIQNNYGGG